MQGVGVDGFRHGNGSTEVRRNSHAPHYCTFACKRSSWPVKKPRKARAVKLHWKPGWSVWRHSDAFPGQNNGTVRVSEGLGVLPKIAKCKAFCEAKGWGGYIFAQGQAYFRQATQEDLEEKALELKGACLCLRKEAAPDRALEPLAQGLKVAVLASQDEFEETLYSEPEIEVSSAGNGRRYATHALLRCLASAAPTVTLVAILVLDWRSEDGSVPRRPLPRCGPELLEVQVHNGPLLPAWRGSSEQLLNAVAGELKVDLAVATVPRYDMLSVLHGCVFAKRYCLMGHDYQLPYGPWGTREAVLERHEMHCRLLDATTVLCTSEHLAGYLQTWSQGRVDSRLCYCADYGYFPMEEKELHKDPEELTVTFISPCPAKGLSIFKRLALELPDVKFLAVSTLWTRTIHEAQLRKLPNVELIRGSSDVDAIYSRTSILLVPSVWCEAFGLVAVEAQLRGIPVISTDAYGLREANLLPELRVPGVPLVQDMKIRTLHRGKTIDVLERTLPPDRTERERSEEEKQRIAYEAHFHVATMAEARGFLECLQALLQDPPRRRRLGNLAQEEARCFLRERRGRFLQQIQAICKDE